MLSIISPLFDAGRDCEDSIDIIVCPAVLYVVNIESIVGSESLGDGLLVDLRLSAEGVLKRSTSPSVWTAPSHMAQRRVQEPAEISEGLLRTGTAAKTPVSPSALGLSRGSPTRVHLLPANAMQLPPELLCRVPA